MFEVKNDPLVHVWLEDEQICWDCVAGASTNPQDRFRLIERTPETHTGELNSPNKELQNAQHHNHIYNKTFSNAHIKTSKCNLSEYKPRNTAILNTNNAMAWLPAPTRVPVAQASVSGCFQRILQFCFSNYFDFQDYFCGDLKLQLVPNI